MRLSVSLLIFISTAYCADFTTYIGGPGLAQSVSVAQIAIDSAGNTYVTGTRLTEPQDSNNVFVTKVDPTGNIVFTTTFGQGASFGNTIAVDPTGNIWVGGQTVATNFPLVNALQSSPGSYPGSGFLAKLTPDGTIAYSSYFGGALGNTIVNAVATDSNGNVYVTGTTDASDFPTTPGLPASPVGVYKPDPGASVSGVFATKLDSTGKKILYSTVIAGPDLECLDLCGPSGSGLGIAVDGAGNAYLAAITGAPAPSGAVNEAFVFKVDAGGNQLGYFHYFGSNTSVTNSLTTAGRLSSPIAVDASSNVYLAGLTNSSAFPTTPGAYQTALSSGATSQAFILKLDTTGDTIWASLFGPNGSDATAIAVAIDTSNNVWLTGTSSTGTGSGFVAELSADGSTLPYFETFPTGEAGQDVVVDPSGVVHFAGSIGLISTITPTQPLPPRVLSIVNAASGQFTGTVAPGEIISIYGLEVGPTAPVTATPANGVFPTSLGGVQVLVNGTPIPLLYVSASQINAEIPLGIASGGLTNGIALVQVVNTTIEWDPVQKMSFMEALPDFRLAVVGSNFAVFENAGSMAVINQDGSLNKLANPAKLGTVVTIWATGFGATGSPVDGAVAAAANNFCGTCQLTLSNRGTSITETVQYAGSSPGLIDGLMQINFLIPMQFSGDLGAFVYFTPPGYSQPLLLGWVNVSP